MKAPFVSWTTGMRQAATGAMIGLAAALPMLATAGGMGAADGAAAPQADHRQAGGRHADFVQVPGIQRQQIGHLQVTALLDGVVPLPLTLLKGIDPAKARAWARRAHLPQQPAGVQTAVNAFLVRRGDRLMLVDTGGGVCMGEGLGRLAPGLKQAGVDPADVTDVLLTHAHPDHVCGLVDAEGRAAFAGATVWLPAPEAAFWMSGAQKAGASEDLQKYADMAVKALAPYRQAGRLQQVDRHTTLPPGVQLLASPGHTPGHGSWLVDGSADAGKPVTAGEGVKVRGGTEKLLLWGDIVHFHAVQFTRPGVWVDFDVNARQAVASRRQMMARAARQGWWVAGAHLPFPGIGHVVPEGKGYRWVRTEFGPVTMPAR